MLAMMNGLRLFWGFGRQNVDKADTVFDYIQPIANMV